MLAAILTAISLVLSGLLAGEEFVVRWGVHPALAALDTRAHLLARKALVRRLMVLVPALMIPTVLAAVAVLVLAGGTGAALALHIVGFVLLAVFVAVSFGGTVPINIAVNDTWDADAPPADWREVVARWTLIDTVRSSAAVLAFAALVAAVVVQFLP